MYIRAGARHQHLFRVAMRIYFMAGRTKGATFDRERGSRLTEELKKMFPGEKYRVGRAQRLGLSESSLRNWEDGIDIDNRALAAVSHHGGDIHYILTGERQEQRKEMPHHDPLEALNPPPRDCPNGGLCGRLAKLVALLREFSHGAIFDADDKLLEVAILAVAKHRAAPVRQAAMETFEQSPVVDADRKKA
jgi:hypothetical protein